MVINRIHILRFGALRDREFTVMPGLNIIEGENESGKTTVAAFLRYLFYGIGRDSISARFLTSYPVSEEAVPIGGTLDITLSTPTAEYPDVTEYRISRMRTPSPETGAWDETCTVCPLQYGIAGAPVYVGEIPGERFFGVSGEVFSASAFVGQAGSVTHAKASSDHTDTEGSFTGGSPIRAAIDRILHTANEDIDPDAAIRALTEKRNALYDPDTDTGSIRDLERRRSVLAATLEDAERAAHDAAESGPEPVSDTDMSAEEPEINVIEEPERDPETEQKLRAGIAAFDAAIAEKEARAARLQKIIEQYEAYRALDDLDTLKGLKQQQSAAEVRAASLAAAVFRGNYIPDADYSASLHLCAEDMKTAAEQCTAAKAELEKLDFSVRRDNLKEKQMRRIELDGGADAIRARLDGLYGKRAVVTVFGIFLLLFTVFAFATTVFLLVLRSDSFTNGILVTAILGALAFFFFLSRSRYERAIGVMLKRYACTTEDELENFIEEYVLTSGKLHALTENKEALSARLSEQSLQGSEAARQAAILLSKLQPPDAARITADRLTPEVVSTAADRVDRALAELDSLYQTADACRDEITRYVEEHGAANEEALYARRQTLAALFEKNGGAFRIEPIRTELEGTRNTIQDLRRQQLSLQNALAPQSASGLPETKAAPAPVRVFRRASAADCGPDPRLLRTLLAEMDDKLRRDRKQYAALNMAIDGVRCAADTLHRSIAPRLTENAGKLMALLSDKRYSALLLDEDMQLCAAQNSEDGSADALPIDILSAGTQDLAYLSLRMALLHMLYPKELPPLLFDEAFSTLDDRRLSRMIALLHRASTADNESNTSQAVVFTCHKRERRAAEALSPCHVLKL